MYYDAAHNLTRIDHPRGGGSTLMAYDNLNRLDLVTDPNGAQTDYVYFGSGADAAKDRPQSVIAAKGTAEQTTTTYTYTASGAAIGRVATITDGDGLVTTKTYDALGQPDITTLPGGFTLNENYSTQGNLDSVVDANGRTTSFTYNKRRRGGNRKRCV
jgi:YD repeat-containing protein